MELYAAKVGTLGDFVKFITDDIVINQDTWYHVAGTANLSAENMDIYVDGVEKPSTKNTGGTPPTVFEDSSIPFELGSITFSTSRIYFNGTID